MTATIVALAILLLAAIFGLAAMHIQRKQDLTSANQRCSDMNDRLTTGLAHAQQDRQRLLDGLGDAYLLIDESQHILFANSASYDLFHQRELLGRPAHELLLHPEFTRTIESSIKHHQLTQTNLVFTQQTSPLGSRENRGTNAWFIDAAPLPGSEHTYRVLIRDITSQHTTEQIRKDFVANASHELRTPLAIIDGYLENLIEDDLIEDPAMARRFLTIMRKHATRISRIVEDMLVISKLESGEATALNIKPFPLQGCLNDVIERLESLIRQKNAQVTLKLENPDLTIDGDRFYFTQVFFNLVENALKQNLEPGLHIEIGSSTENGHHHIWVSDDGIGIPSAALPHIFRRFYRVEKHHSQQEIKGTGLGLSIVKRAIEAHGGLITVTSTPGKETKFLITLPVDAR